MNYEDFGTRKLKRKYIEQIKLVWYYQKTSYYTDFSVEEALNLAHSMKKELEHRGWRI